MTTDRRRFSSGKPGSMRRPRVGSSPSLRRSSGGQEKPLGRSDWATMNEQERLVAIISPWEKIAAVVKRHFRVESLPAEKKVMVWRDDLQNESALVDELKSVGIQSVEVRKNQITQWEDVE
jgi:hypothetical protein